MNKSFFIEKNLNPWGQNIDDCAIRAISAALMMKYEAVCKLFRKECKEGYGLVGSDGISLAQIKSRLDKFFDKVEDADDMSLDNVPDDLKDMKMQLAVDKRNGMTIEDFIKLYGQNPNLGLTLDDFCYLYSDTGRYLVSLLDNHGSNNRHMVYADLKPNHGWFYDTDDCSSRPVEAYMRIKYILDPNDPRSLLYKKSKDEML